MKKNILKKTLVAALTLCTVISSSSFGNMTAWAGERIVKDKGQYTIGSEKRGSITPEEYQEESHLYTFKTDKTDSYYKLSYKAYNGSGILDINVGTDFEITEVESTYVHSGESDIKDLDKKLKPDTEYKIELFSDTAVNYMFKIEKYSTDDFPDTPEGFKNFTIGKEQTGYLNSRNDRDHFTFTTGNDKAFHTINFKAIGTGGGAAEYKICSDREMTETVWESYVHQGEVDTADLKNLLLPNKKYYMVISGYTDDFAPMKYSMKLTGVKDDVQDEVSKAENIEVNKTFSGKIQNRVDVDFFKVTATSYTKYSIYFKATAGDKLVNLTVYKDKYATESIYETYIRGGNSLQGAKLTLTPGRTYYIKIDGEPDAKYVVGLMATAPGKASVKKIKSKVTISWGKLAKAKGYEVYRATGTSNKFKCIKTIKSANTTKYVDKSVKKKKTYKYKVRAYAVIGGKKCYSSFSPVKTIKVK